MDADETGPGVIAIGFANRNFMVGLGIGHPSLNLFHNLCFGESGIFQASDLWHVQCGNPLQAALQNELYETVGKADQAKGDRVPTNGVELIGFGDSRI